MNSPKTVVVTGGTSGIGLRAVQGLVGDGHRVIVGARRDVDVEGAEVCRLDLASLESVRAFSEGCPPTDVVLANAGVQIVSDTFRSEDGFELTFAVNHLAHLALIHHLRSKLTPAARVVITVSGTHNPEEKAARLFGFQGGLYTGAARLAQGDVGQIRSPRLLGMDRYATSKLANVMTVVELSRRVSADRLQVFGFDPGLVPATGLVRDQPPSLQRIYRLLSPLLTVLPGASTPERSGAALAWLATESALTDQTGAFFDYGRRPARIWAGAYQPNPCRELFDDCLGLMSQSPDGWQGLGGREPPRAAGA